MTTLDDLKSWFQRGVAEGATHMIVACDTFDWEDYPIYVKPGEDPRKVVAEKVRGDNMQKLMEVYHLKASMESQMKPGTRVYNYELPTDKKCVYGPGTAAHDCDDRACPKPGAKGA